ncbi:hypothetical protein DS885_03915 [Psychromonas sp. B3M02]|uniref:plasmid replication initiator RepA n=1 Tax=Psychromonas sp. B3M02 TaxID=2267226 RepID=UPI000DEBD405|nr:plasmid replication initiator RepA [Psychromonas sp. B3M02]RBW47303.1 hypothetical protein DS885_03915 [Psychromonas sp. B3M02]
MKTSNVSSLVIDNNFHLLSDTKQYNPNKIRKNYSRKARNPNPTYTVPDSHIKRLSFIKELVHLSKIKDVTRSDVAMYSRATGERKRRFYPDREKAIKALFSVFCEHVNLVTHQVEISLRNASDASGLSTISQNEIDKSEADKNYTPITSISRASRAFKDMVLMGWIVAPKHWQIWDKERGYWLDKYFEVTPLFFKALGVTPERVEKQQQNRLTFLKKRALDSGMTAETVGRMSISQIKAERKIAWRRYTFDRRKTEQTRKKEKRLLNGKSRAEQRNVAALKVIKILGDNIHEISTQDFTDLVNKEIATMRKFTNLKPPLH